MGYFRLGDTFLALGNVEVALDFYDKVVDIWYKYLTKLYSVQSSTNKIETKGILSLAVPNKPDTKAIEETDMNFGESLTEEEIADGRSQLAQILDNRRRILGNRHIAIGEVQYTLGLFEYLILNSDNAASTFTLAALEAYESNYGFDHLSTKHVAAVHELINSNR
jgi:tetratricopeptide (TPR) repeat protein